MQKNGKKWLAPGLFFYILFFISCRTFSGNEVRIPTQTALAQTKIAVETELSALAATATFPIPTATATVSPTLAPTLTPIPTRTPNGIAAYKFCLPGLDGGEYCLKDYQGKLVILSFFSTNCPYCRKEAPIIQKMHLKYQDQGLVILGIAPSEVGKNAIKKYVTEYKLSYPILLDKSEKVGMRYALAGLGVPRSYFIDPYGYLSSFHVGAMPEDDWEDYITRNLPTE